MRFRVICIVICVLVRLSGSQRRRSLNVAPVLAIRIYRNELFSTIMTSLSRIRSQPSAINSSKNVEKSEDRLGKHSACLAHEQLQWTGRAGIANIRAVWESSWLFSLFLGLLSGSSRPLWTRSLKLEGLPDQYRVPHQATKAISSFGTEITWPV